MSITEYLLLLSFVLNVYLIYRGMQLAKRIYYLEEINDNLKNIAAANFIKVIVKELDSPFIHYSLSQKEALERRYIVSRLKEHKVDYNKGADIKELITILNLYEEPKYELGDWTKYYKE